MEIAKIKISGTSVEVSDLKTVTSGMVGATVGITYDDTWDGLNKQVVFKTAFKTVNADGTAVPPELLRISGVNLQVGVYGYTDDGTVAIPTVWASLGNIQPGADPEGDEAAKPTNPIWIEAIETAKNADRKSLEALEAAVSAERKADSASGLAVSASDTAASAAEQATEASEKADAALEELHKLNGVLPAVTVEDAGKALVVSADGKIIADDGMVEQDVLPEQVLTFTQQDPDNPENPYVAIQEETPFKFRVGETYYVVWDGVVYQCLAKQFVDSDAKYIYIGNAELASIGDATDEPFCIEDVYANDTLLSSGALTNSPDLTLPEVSHNVRIYQMVKDTSSQSDWNINDETDPAYIKNRPFYTGDPVLTELLPETTLQFTDGTASITDAPDLMLEKLSQNDQTYIVIWDGTEYEVTASPFNGIPCLGNLSIEVPEHENTGEPFLFLHFDQWVVVTNDAGAEHTISVNHAERAIRKLPSKFLADDVGNKLPFFDLKEMGMTDVTSMNAVKTLSVDTTRLRAAMLNGQIKIAFGVDGAVIKTVLSFGIISGNAIYASALILNPQNINGLELSPVIVALIAMEGGIYFILKEIGATSTSSTQE